MDILPFIYLFWQSVGPIQLVQWTFAAAPGHPILIDTLRRLVSSLDLDPSSLTRSRIFSDANIESEAQRIMRVVRSSGPGPFTDAVLRYVGALTQGEVVWSSLRNVPPNGLRIGDILVLPISGFSPGIRMMVRSSFSQVFFKFFFLSLQPFRIRTTAIKTQSPASEFLFLFI